MEQGVMHEWMIITGPNREPILSQNKLYLVPKSNQQVNFKVKSKWRWNESVSKN